MINDIFNIVDTILNKENNGYVSPSEKNLIAKQVQEEIFSDYFADSYKDGLKIRSSLLSKGYANLSFIQRQKVNRFSADSDISATAGDPFILPSDLYFIEDDGVISSTGDVVEEVERREFGYLNNSISAPDTDFPVYERYANEIHILPNTLTDINVRYIRKPKTPKWTYTIVSDKEFFDDSKGTYQDFELDPSEFSNIVIRMCFLFGINLRENDVVKVMGDVKNQEYIKENS